MHKIGAFFSNRSNEPDPSTELVTLNLELQRQNRELSSKDNTQTLRINQLEKNLCKKRELVKSQKALLEDLNRQNTDLASRISKLQKEYDSYWTYSDELIPKVEAVTSVLDRLVRSAVDIAENKIKDKPLETKVKTLEADLSSIITQRNILRTQRNILRTQRNILAISLAVFAGSFVFFKLKK